MQAGGDADDCGDAEWVWLQWERQKNVKQQATSMMITARTDPKSAAELWRCKLRLVCVQMLGARRQQHDGSRCTIPAHRRSGKIAGGDIHGNITCVVSAVLNSMEAAAEAVCVCVCGSWSGLCELRKTRAWRIW